MAKITKTVAAPVIPPTTYTLELSEAEAELVYALVGTLVGGGTYRRASDRIYAAFYEVLGTGCGGHVDLVEGARLRG